jgi:hypothetical protein
MTMRDVVLGALALLGTQICGPAAEAAGVDGAWVTDADACKKVFVKTGNRISFAKKADLHGSGFVIEGNRIRGKIANCTVKARKQDGETVHLGAACSTDVAVETVQFTLKLDGEDRIIRMFPGLSELDTPYFRCSL